MNVKLYKHTKNIKSVTLCRLDTIYELVYLSVLSKVYVVNCCG